MDHGLGDVETPLVVADEAAGVGLDRFFESARPDELAAHLARCLAWLRARPDAAPARAALIYAWNENDEGGWLVPTHPFDAARLDAIRRVLCEDDAQDVASGAACRRRGS